MCVFIRMNFIVLYDSCCNSDLSKFWLHPPKWVDYWNPYWLMYCKHIVQIWQYLCSSKKLIAIDHLGHLHRWLGSGRQRWRPGCLAAWSGHRPRGNGQKSPFHAIQSPAAATLPWALAHGNQEDSDSATRERERCFIRFFSGCDDTLLAFESDPTGFLVTF